MTEYDVMADAYRQILASQKNEEEAIASLVKRLCADLPASVIAVDAAGFIAAMDRTERFNPFDREQGQRLDNVLADGLADLQRDLVNVSMDELPVRTAVKNDIKKYNVCVFPVTVFGKRAGSLLIYRKECGFIHEEIRFCTVASCLIGLIMAAIANESYLEEQRKKETVRVVTDSLSYSELMVSSIIFRELEGSEGIIVASRIADAEGITRSVIVNAIRKLESAGVLESRSLGMKGTYIKILNEYFSSEIAKIKK